MFVEENVHADGTTRRARGPPKRVPAVASIVTIEQASVGLDQPERRTSSLSAALSQDIVTCAQAKYAHAFLRSAHGMQSALTGYLIRYGLPESSIASPSLSHRAMTAVTLVFFGLSENSMPACTLSRQVYEQALITTNARIQSMVSVPTDDLLLAVMLLGCYEGHTGDRLDLSAIPNTFRHVRGATSLLEARQAISNHSQQSRALDTVVWRRATRMAIQTGLHLEPIIRTCIEQQDDDDIVTRLVYDRMSELAEISADLHDYLRSQPGGDQYEMLRPILDRALELDIKLTSLGRIISISERYRPTVQPQPQCGGVLRAIMHTHYGCIHYPSIHAAHETTVFYACWLRVKDIIMSCIAPRSLDNNSPLGSANGLYFSSVQSSMEELIHSIFASVPYTLGDLDSPAKTIDDVCLNANGAHCGQIVFALHSIFSARNVTIEHRRMAAQLLIIASKPSANGLVPAYIKAACTRRPEL